MEKVVPECEKCGLGFIRIDDKNVEYKICKDCENKQLKQEVEDLKERHNYLMSMIAKLHEDSLQEG